MAVGILKGRTSKVLHVKNRKLREMFIFCALFLIPLLVEGYSCCFRQVFLLFLRQKSSR